MIIQELASENKCQHFAVIGDDWLIINYQQSPYTSNIHAFSC